MTGMALLHHRNEQSLDNADGSMFRLLTFQPVLKVPYVKRPMVKRTKNGQKNKKQKNPKQTVNTIFQVLLCRVV